MMARAARASADAANARPPARRPHQRPASGLSPHGPRMLISS